jgi:FtsZ-interacting cell division protein ZipA
VSRVSLVSEARTSPPCSRPERVISAAEADRMDKGQNGTVIQLNINASRSQPLDGWAIIEALQKIEQTSGPLPIKVRTD